MKKFILAALAFVAMAMPNNALAQSYRYNPNTPAKRSTASNFFEHTDMYYGVRLGVGFNSISSSSTFIRGNSTLAGLNIGGVVGFALTDEAPLFVETGVSYAQKGGKGSYTTCETEGPSKTYDAKYNLGYLQIPAVIKYAYAADEQLSIQPFAGVFLDTGLGGSIKVQSGTNDRGKRPAFSDYDKDDVHFKRFDIGLKLGCGVSYDVFYGEVYYDLGLANTCNDIIDTTHNRRLGINIGVNF